jgi:hypothetical protein
LLLFWNFDIFRHMEQLVHAPSPKTAHLAAIMELLAQEFPDADRTTLGTAFLTCKWHLQPGECLDAAYQRARLLLAGPPERIRLALRLFEAKEQGPLR